jgi:hypothetical protein
MTPMTAPELGAHGSWLDALTLDDAHCATQRTDCLLEASDAPDALDVELLFRAFVVRIATEGQSFVDDFAARFVANGEKCLATVTNHETLRVMRKTHLPRMEVARSAVLLVAERLDGARLPWLAELRDKVALIVQRAQQEVVTRTVEFGTDRAVPAPVPASFKRKG